MNQKNSLIVWKEMDKKFVEYSGDNRGQFSLPATSQPTINSTPKGSHRIRNFHKILLRLQTDFLKSNAFLFALQKRDMLIAQCLFKWLKNILYGGHPSKFYFSIVNVNSAIIGCRKHFLHNLKQQPSIVFSNANCNQFQNFSD